LTSFPRPRVGAPLPRRAFAPFLAETYEPPAIGGEGDHIVEKAIQQLYNFRLKTLRDLEPDNPYLQRNRDPGAIPSFNELDQIGRELDAANQRHAERALSPNRRSGASEQAVTWRAAHDFHKAGTVAKDGRGNVKIGKSGRADGLFRSRKKGRLLIEEFKRKDQLKRAEREAEAYAKEHERLQNQPTDWRGTTYDADELWDHLRRNLKE